MQVHANSRSNLVWLTLRRERIFAGFTVLVRGGFGPLRIYREGETKFTVYEAQRSQRTPLKVFI